MTDAMIDNTRYYRLRHGKFDYFISDNPNRIAVVAERNGIGAASYIFDGITPDLKCAPKLPDRDRAEIEYLCATWGTRWLENRA